MSLQGAANSKFTLLWVYIMSKTQKLREKKLILGSLTRGPQSLEIKHAGHT